MAPAGYGPSAPMNSQYAWAAPGYSAYPTGPAGYNPYAANNLAFAVSWWHGWDTAEEESKDEVAQPRQGDTPARMPVPDLSKKK